jgi:hypothetical protein
MEDKNLLWLGIAVFGLYLLKKNKSVPLSTVSESGVLIPVGSSTTLSNTKLPAATGLPLLSVPMPGDIPIGVVEPGTMVEGPPPTTTMQGFAGGFGTYPTH